ncbi:chromosomal replication initiator protein DnaA [Patescibacteria group bacterium]|nr:chromosomal replication initiator protein DnaA [Patescibacteria group bacterium]MBP9709861.1 chromosomal replication initiator protein DnaA [Patescibacteria group bacterium]
MDLQALWQSALGEIELTLSKANFTTWFRNTFISSYENGRIVVAVPNTFTKSWLERKYHDAIAKALRSACPQPIREIHYRVEVRNTTVLPIEHLAEPAPSPGMEQEMSQASGAEGSFEPTTRAAELGLNPRYTFPQFIVGKNNELAHAACMAVSAKPGQAYNPLFIYGGVGMGKTHLLQAIGHHVCRDNNNAKVQYVTCERFTNEFIQAVRSGAASDFKDRYRTVDVLLIDDIQFLTGKEGTQEEFFHTFNTLHQNNKQIVIASDRPPKDIQTLESRLQSRFEWGMMIDITKPDFETRVAILEAKSREKSYPLSTEILHMMAGAIQSNIRELEGALNKIIAYHQFKNIQPSSGSIQPLLQSFTPTITKRTVSPRLLIEAVRGHYDITHEQIVGKSREQRFALPRQIAMYLLREETKCSFPTIGDHLGGRDHTTAMHACEKITHLIQNDTQVKQDITLILEHLYNSAA